MDIKKGIKRPLEGFTSMCERVTYFNDAKQMEIENHLPPYKKVCRSFYRCSEVGTVSIFDVENLPDEYKKTLRGRNAQTDSAFFNERWLLHSSSNLLIFGSDEDLNVLYESTIWIADGTFKACPPGFSQIYTILGYGKYKNEAIPCIIALMKGRSADAYEAFFNLIKTKLLEKFNHLGKVSMFLCDFESPVIKTVTKLFPQIRVRGCIFHFAQALLRHMTGIREHLTDGNDLIRFV